MDCAHIDGGRRLLVGWDMERRLCLVLGPIRPLRLVAAAGRYRPIPRVPSRLSASSISGIASRGYRRLPLFPRSCRRLRRSLRYGNKRTPSNSRCRCRRGPSAPSRGYTWCPSASWTPAVAGRAVGLLQPPSHPPAPPSVRTQRFWRASRPLRRRRPTQLCGLLDAGVPAASWGVCIRALYAAT